jgi:hypothetical protein
MYNFHSSSNFTSKPEPSDNHGSIEVSNVRKIHILWDVTLCQLTSTTDDSEHYRTCIIGFKHSKQNSHIRKKR